MIEIIQKVAKRYGFKPSDITGPSNVRAFRPARDEVCSLLDGMGLTLEHIGRLVNRDHSTVLYAIRRRHMSLGYPYPIKGRKPQPWHVVGNHTRDKAWRIYRGPQWLATQAGRKALKATNKSDLEELLAREYAQ